MKGAEALKKWREENPEGVGHGPVRNPMQKWQDKDTRKTAVDAKCWECCGGSEDESEGVRGAIRDCTATNCPLHAWRPYR